MRLCFFMLHFTSVRSSELFEQQNMDFFAVFGHGIVLHSFGHYNDLTFVHDLCPVSKLHVERPFDDMEQFIFILVGAPDKFSL